MSIGDFSKYAFPLIRKAMPSLIANDIINIQPMTAVSWLFSHFRGKLPIIDEESLSIVEALLYQAMLRVAQKGVNFEVNRATAIDGCHIKIRIFKRKDIDVLIVDGKIALQTDMASHGVMLDLHDPSKMDFLDQELKNLIVPAWQKEYYL